MKQLFGLLPFAILIDRDRFSAVELDQLHTGNIGQAVADIDHVRKWNATRLIREIFIQLVIPGDVQYPLVNAEEELSLAGVVHCQLRPICLPAWIIMKFAGVNLFELAFQRRAFDDFFHTGRDDVMFD